MAVYLHELQQPHLIRARPVPFKPDPADVERFAALPEVAALGWPLDVVQQWLYEHLPHDEFLADYADLDLTAVVWSLEDVPTDGFLTMRTGPSEDSYLASIPDQHRHWTEQRRHLGVAERWENDGTWQVPPLLLDLGCMDGPAGVLQVVEGRTRVGILQGRTRDRLHVADHHAAWVGRPRDQRADQS